VGRSPRPAGRSLTRYEGAWAPGIRAA
jgi:hypothetical protein